PAPRRDRLPSRPRRASTQPPSKPSAHLLRQFQESCSFYPSNWLRAAVAGEDGAFFIGTAILWQPPAHGCAITQPLRRTVTLLSESNPNRGACWRTASAR